LRFISVLSRRELEVIESILAGCLSYKEIAVSLNISVHTVKKHLQHIYKATGVSNIAALIVLFKGYFSKLPQNKP
jgi:DNA-binding CsgD family transcriptional regulator